MRFLQRWSWQRPMRPIQNRRRTQVGDSSKPVFTLLTPIPFKVSLSRRKNLLVLRKSIPPEQFLPNKILIDRKTRNSSGGINDGSLTRRHQGIHSWWSERGHADSARRCANQLKRPCVDTGSHPFCYRSWRKDLQEHAKLNVVGEGEIALATFESAVRRTMVYPRVEAPDSSEEWLCPNLIC